MASTAEIHQCPYLKVFQLEPARNKGIIDSAILINISLFSV